ncbi:MAG: CbtB-domain containing protein [Pseudomonadota bacterium]|nr:CbtB-domain containing protein [Pseudomonadota bacterium]
MSISLNSDLIGNQSAAGQSVLQRLAPVAAATALGCLLIFAMGFADISSLHNAAHDGRHSAGFPCH